MRVILFLMALMTFISSTTLANDKHKTVTLAGGCFWCIETDFEKLDGVIDAVSGYAGGDHPAPTYQNYNKLNDIYKTSHIEVIQVTYDSNKLSFKDILEYHHRHIDPTDGSGQFCDRGESYRPAVFVKNSEQRKIASQVNKETAKILEKDTNIDILDDAPFTKAEDYHQDYSKKNPVRYKFYRWNCGRDQSVAKIWGKKPPKNLTINK